MKLSKKNTLQILYVFGALLAFCGGYIVGEHSTTSSVSSAVLDFESSASSTPNASLVADTVINGLSNVLVEKRGGQFDSDFLTDITIQNQGSVNLAHAALQFSQNKETKNLAELIIKIQLQEMAIIQRIRTSMRPQ